MPKVMDGSLVVSNLQVHFAGYRQLQCDELKIAQSYKCLVVGFLVSGNHCISYVWVRC